MFKKLTVAEQLQKERTQNLVLLNRTAELEDALLELATIIAEEE